MEEERERIRARFKKIIAESGMKKDDIIEKTPYPRTSFFKVLKGDRLPSLDDLLNLCQLLNRNLAEFFIDDLEKNQVIEKERDDYKEKYLLAKKLLDIEERYRGNNEID